jgi:hypothetical protein
VRAALPEARQAGKRERLLETNGISGILRDRGISLWNQQLQAALAVE